MSFKKTDYDRLRNYNPGGGGGAKEWFRPKPGAMGADKRYTLRILPAVHTDLPFYDSEIHYFRSIKGFVSGECPRVEGGECRACEVYFALREAVGSTGAEAEALRKLQAKTRVYANVIVLQEDKDEIPVDDQKVQIWSMTYSCAKMIQEEIDNNLEAGVEILDPKSGRDLVVKITKMGAAHKVDTVSVKPKATPITLKDAADQAHDLKAKAKQRQFTAEEVAEQIEPVLGDFYESFMEKLG